MSDRDYVAFIEACYRVEQDEVSWLRGVAEAAVPLMPFGQGVHAYFVDLHRDDGPLLERPMLVGGVDAWEERWRRDWWDTFMDPMDDEHKRLLHSLTSVCDATEVWAAAASKSATYSDYVASCAERGYSQFHLRRLGDRQVKSLPPGGERFLYPDSFNVGGIDAEGRGAVLLANMPEVAAGDVPPAEEGLWSRLGAHIAAGHRLLRRLRGRVGSDGAEVIVDPQGRLQHVDPVVRDKVALESLRERVVAIDSARAKQRSDGRVATEVWTGLAEGRWSLVDQFDRDGRRFYLARVNVPSTPVAKLTEREAAVARAASHGHSNKLIAYELGIPASTVASHLKSACAKLGAPSRTALIRIVRGSLEQG
jgi:DNA-binding CsgD family transcriptional regulator